MDAQLSFFLRSCIVNPMSDRLFPLSSRQHCQLETTTSICQMGFLFHVTCQTEAV